MITFIAHSTAFLFFGVWLQLNSFKQYKQVTNTDVASNVTNRWQIRM